MDIVLIEPEIPQNTGSIARTCAATETALHLVGKLGFELNEKKIRRAGLDYWPYVQLFQHASWDDYLALAKPNQTWLISTRGSRFHFEASFSENDALVFGNETSGVSNSLRMQFEPEHVLRIPMPCSEVRSLNLSNAVSIVLYEARRQLGADSSGTS